MLIFNIILLYTAALLSFPANESRAEGSITEPISQKLFKLESG